MFYCKWFFTEGSLMGVKSVTVTVAVTMWVPCFFQQKQKVENKRRGRFSVEIR